MNTAGDKYDHEILASVFSMIVNCVIAMILIWFAPAAALVFVILAVISIVSALAFSCL